MPIRLEMAGLYVLGGNWSDTGGYKMIAPQQLKNIAEDLPVKKAFFSRRNRVVLKELPWDNEVILVVVKEHRNEKKARDELEILTNLARHKVKVPVCYGCYLNKVFTQYIPGTLLNCLVDNFADYGPGWIDQLARWYHEFHQATLTPEGKVILKDDNNLRNFLLYDNTFYGVDFEAPVYGFAQQDIGRCCAYILTNTPAFTREKFFIVKELINCYIKRSNLVTRPAVREEIIIGLQELAQYRVQQREEILRAVNLGVRLSD